MANKVKYNLKNVHTAKLTKGEDGNYSYETPKAIPGAVSISLATQEDRNKFQDCKTLHQRYRYCPIYWSWFQWTLGNN